MKIDYFEINHVIEYPVLDVLGINSVQDITMYWYVIVTMVVIH